MSEFNRLDRPSPFLKPLLALVVVSLLAIYAFRPISLTPLFIDSVPQSASVFVNGHFAGVTPLETRFPLGEGTVRMEKAGYKTTIVLVRELNCPVKLVPAPTGTLKITAHPRTCTVFLDGLEYGKTPLTLNSTPVGTYEIRVEKANYLSYVGTVSVERGETAEIRAELEDTLLAYLVAAAEVAPENPYPHMDLGHYYFLLDHVDDSLASYKNAMLIVRHPDFDRQQFAWDRDPVKRVEREVRNHRKPELWPNRAKACAKFAEKSVPLHKKIKRAFPDDVKKILERAENKAKNAAKDVGAMIEAWRNAEKEAPGNPDICIRLAGLLLKQGEVDAAVSKFRSALDMMCSGPGAGHRVAAAAIDALSTQSSEKVETCDEALEFARTLLHDAENDARTLDLQAKVNFDLARLLQLSGDTDEAIQALKKAVAFGCALAEFSPDLHVREDFAAHTETWKLKLAGILHFAGRENEARDVYSDLASNAKKETTRRTAQSALKTLAPNDK